MRFREGLGNWTQYRLLTPTPEEVDFHYPSGTREVPYWDAMANIGEMALDALRDAHLRGVKWVIFMHGCSTSGPGRITARSVVRGLMRSSEATPFIHRSECIQHESVFVAAIKKKGEPPRGGGENQ